MPRSAAALVVAGVWLGGLAATWVVASVNFRTVDRVLGPARRAELDARLTGLAADDRRMVLRHLASEINRFLFRGFGAAQLAAGAGLLALAWSGGRARLVVLAALGAVIAQIALTGPIVELGRQIDFVPRPLPPDLARRFGLLHAAYVGLDLAKAVALVAAAWLLARGR
jgi:hypothetical protein